MIEGYNPHHTGSIRHIIHIIFIPCPMWSPPRKNRNSTELCVGCAGVDIVSREGMNPELVMVKRCGGYFVRSYDHNKEEFCNRFNKPITLEVSRLGFTRWVPGSCLPHPLMAGVDWPTLAWVKVGSQSQWRLGSLFTPIGSTTKKTATLLTNQHRLFKGVANNFLGPNGWSQVC